MSDYSQLRTELEHERAINAGLRQRIRELTTGSKDERKAARTQEHARVWLDSDIGPVVDIGFDGPWRQDAA